MGAGLEYGIKITADSKLAVGAARQADKALEGLDRRGKAVTATAQKQTRSSGRQTQALRTLTKETQKASSKLSSLERQTRVQTRAVLKAAKANRDAARAIAAGRAATERARVASRAAEAQHRRTASSAVNLASAMRLVGGLSLALMARQAITVADSWTLMEGRMSLVVRTGESVSTVMGDLHRRAQEARADFSSFNKVYFRTARALSQNIRLADKAADVTSILAKSARISGAGAQESAAGLLQLSQALSSGELRGEEFRSVMENIPDVAKRIADGLGEPITALRGLAEAGELTTSRVVTALLSQKDAVEAEFKKLPRTVAEAWVQLRNDITKELGEGSRATNATGGLTDAIDRLRTAVSTVVPVVVGLLSATTSLAAVAADNLDIIVALASGYGAARVALKAFTAVQALNLGTMVKARVVTLGMTALMAGNYARALKVATIGWRGLTAAMVANPIGAVAVGIGVVTAALVGWGLSSDEAADKTARLADEASRLDKEMKKVNEILRTAGATRLKTYTDQNKLLLEREKGDLLKLQDDLRRVSSAIPDQPLSDPGHIGGVLGLNTRAVNDWLKTVQAASPVVAELKQDIDDKLTSIAALEKGIKAAEKALKDYTTTSTETANKKLLQHFEGLLKVLDPAAQRTLDLAKAYGALRAARQAGRISEDEHAAYLERLRSDLYPDALVYTEKTVEVLRLEAETLGLSERQRESALIVRRAENEAKKRGLALTEENIDAIRREAGALYDAKKAIEARQKAEQQAARRLENLYRNAAETIQRSLSDAIYDGLNGSLKGVKDFFKSIVNLWKRQVASRLTLNILGKGGPGASISGGIASLLGITAAGLGGSGTFPSGSVAAPGTASGPPNSPLGLLSAGIGKLGDSINDFGKSLGFGKSAASRITDDAVATGTVPVDASGAVKGTPLLLKTFGEGLAIGGLTAGLLGGDSTGGAIGGGLGSIAGTALGGELGGLIGGVVLGTVGGFLKSLFTKTPRAGTRLWTDAGGVLKHGTIRTKGKADQGVVSGLFGLFGSQLDALATSLGASVRGGLSLGEIGYRKDRFFFDPTANARLKHLGRPSRDLDTRTFGSEDGAIKAALAHALRAGAITGVGEEVAAFLKRTTAETIDRVLLNLDFLKVYDQLAGTTRHVSEAEKNIKALNDRFIQAARQARKLGLAVEPVFGAWQRELDKLRSDFETSVRLGLGDITDPARSELTRLRDEQIKRLEEALALGADIGLVQKLNAQEWQRAIERLDGQVNSLFRQYDKSLSLFKRDLVFGSDSLVAPVEQLRAAEVRFADLTARVRGGDEDAASGIFEAARQLLDISRSAFGSSATYGSREAFVRTTLESLRAQLPRTDIAALAGEIGPAALSEKQINNLTETVERGQREMITLLGEIADNTAGSGSGTGPGAGGPGYGPGYGDGYGGGYIGGFAGGSRAGFQGDLRAPERIGVRVNLAARAARR